MIAVSPYLLRAIVTTLLYIFGTLFPTLTLSLCLSLLNLVDFAAQAR